jgi:hypothetical protein
MWIRRLSDLAIITGLALATLDANAAPQSLAHAEADPDPLAGYRGQFKRGMDRYKAGALADAIGYWDPIYRELGEQNGYRLAYDLGVAYQELGDATRAAERLQSFLTEVDVRRERGEPLATIVEKEEADARSRIAGLIATKGRIHVEAVSAPRTARVDASEPRLAGFVSWVTPGEHTVMFAAGTPDVETKRVRVRAGEIVEVRPKAPPPPPPPPEPIVVSLPASPSTPVVTRRETQHPFPWPLIAVSGGVAVATAIAAASLYAYEGALYSRYSLENPRPVDHSDNYNGVRTWAYAAVGGAVGFATVTAGLATWYFLGTSEREVLVTPAVNPEMGGASLGLTGRF